MEDLIIVGGGAAGIFASLSAKAAAPHLGVCVLEKNNVLLSKVRVSGGGRCNVTHACFDPYLLAAHYPRGHKELIGPFHRFHPQHTVEWFAQRGVALKTEPDGRMFPTTDSSSTIIDCLLSEAKKLKVDIRLQQKIQSIEKREACFEIVFAHQEPLLARKVLLTTGSSKEGYVFAQKLGHSIHDPVPSLFTFNVPEFSLAPLSGISCLVEIKIAETKFVQKGPLLITHQGFSGPAVLKLSAWGARYLHAKNYCLPIEINWIPDLSEEQLFTMILREKESQPQKALANLTLFPLPKNLWRSLLDELAESKLITIANKRLKALAQKLHRDVYLITGKMTHKEEFVTCGGIRLEEIDFKTMESKLCPGLFFAGEILDIDGVTGGFNFQNAWTTGHIAGTKMIC